jgi:hypothetical protein
MKRTFHYAPKVIEFSMDMIDSLLETGIRYTFDVSTPDVTGYWWFLGEESEVDWPVISILGGIPRKTRKELAKQLLDNLTTLEPDASDWLDSCDWWELLCNNLKDDFPISEWKVKIIKSNLQGFLNAKEAYVNAQPHTAPVEQLIFFGQLCKEAGIHPLDEGTLGEDDLGETSLSDFDDQNYDYISFGTQLRGLYELWVRKP